MLVSVGPMRKEKRDMNPSVMSQYQSCIVDVVIWLLLLPDLP
jgi:hypothetical protein